MIKFLKKKKVKTPLLLPMAQKQFFAFDASIPKTESIKRKG